MTSCEIDALRLPEERSERGVQLITFGEPAHPKGVE
jgi:hypothetical protein